MFKKTICLVLVLALMTFAIPVSATATGTSEATAEINDECLLLQISNEECDSYYDYYEKYKNEKSAEAEINLGIATTLEEGKSVEAKVTIPSTAIYMAKITYKTIGNSTLKPQLELRIDGKAPFEESLIVDFSRTWKSETEIQQDEMGNDLFQNQIQTRDSQTEYFRDLNGTYNDPYIYYFTAGEHTLSFKAVKCGLEIESLVLCPVRVLPSYEEALKQYQASGLKEITGDFLAKVQAEEPDLKSDTMLSGVSDRTSPKVEPVSSNTTKLNILGGGRFEKSGQWVEYEINDIPEDGLYHLIIKAKQNECKANSVARKIYINGEVPFIEADNFEFEYSTKYQNITLGNDEQAFLVPLKKGTNTVRIEASLGKISEICRSLEDCFDNLTEAYLEMISVTGTSPDANRDYELHVKMPEVIEVFNTEGKKLRKICDNMQELFGGTSSYTAIIETMIGLLERMYEDNYQIPGCIASYNSNLSSLGSVITDLKLSDMSMDYIMVAASDAEIPSATGTFFDYLGYGFLRFFNTFIADYDTITLDSGVDSKITVWITSGTDQHQIIKQIIGSDFVPEYKIAVDFKLVPGTDTLLQAIIAGISPDVALAVPSATVLDFAHRDAIVDLSQFESFEGIKGRFEDSFFDSLTYNGAVYGVPQTATTSVLFYRADILNDIGLEVPRTWDDVYAMLPVLKQMNMFIGIPSTMDMYNIFYYQRGGTQFTEDASAITYDSELAVEVMTDFSRLFTSYGLEQTFSFQNRFVSGEMPLGIATYDTVNTLSAFAPHIKNYWSFTHVPGTVDENGNINHTTTVTITASTIMEKSKNKEAAMTFLNWWSSDETQKRHSNMLESLFGDVGHVATANINVVKNLSWGDLQSENILLALNQTAGIPNIPGTYFIARNFNNAWRNIVDEGGDIRSNLYNATKLINEEIEYQTSVLYPRR